MHIVSGELILLVYQSGFGVGGGGSLTGYISSNTARFTSPYLYTIVQHNRVCTKGIKAVVG